ncbi:hypothetical protein SBRCBS47491_008967 [Sporothrix bragantina]|uniref:Methyltransferase domain-containing protein n=1 Tax=Sporothrix bragantina TaxID=671064 RepID=A0ABP0CSH3_9PEZI
MAADHLNVHHQAGIAEEHGRHFLVNSPQYLFPWDSVEAHRMDLFHKAVTLICSHLGTGTGLWVVEMADRYAGRSEVWGVDLAPFQPHLIPSNAKFQNLDIETHWQLGTGSWDLIHIRCLKGVVRNWPGLYATVLSHLIPGVGHIQQLEMDWAPLDNAGPHLTNWSRILHACMDSTGRPLRVDGDKTARTLREAGFVDVRISRYYLPLSRKRSKRLSPRQTASYPPALSTTSGTSLPSISGMSSPSGSHNYYDEEDSNHGIDNIAAGREVWFPRAFEQWLEGLTLMPMLRAGYSLDAVYRLLADVRQELEDPASNAQCIMYVWTAKCPVQQER